MQTIAITGATGFVGREVTRQFLERGYHVQALVRNERSAAKLEPHPNLKFTYGDPTKADDVLKVLSGAEALVHLVGIRRAETKKTGRTYEDVDVGSAIASVDAMQRIGLKRILFLSAAAIGQSYYVRSKAKAEAAVKSAGLDWTIWQPSFIVGPGQQWPVVMGPFLWLLGRLPGRIGEVSRRAANMSRKQLAMTFWKALEDDSTICQTLDVPKMQAFVNS